MELIRGLNNLQRHRDCVATIGNFDGVHLGHQAIFKCLEEQARRRGLPATIIIFEPQPIEFLAPEEAPSRLSPLRDKLQGIRRTGVDRVVCLRFDRQMANQDAGEFIRETLCGRMGIRCLVAGDDFRFGRQRRGNIKLLKQIGNEKGLEVASIPAFFVAGERVSSTLVRNALLSGDLRRAESLLGRPYRISGRVVHGDKRGRSLGFPTANMKLHRHQSPVRGIFTVRVLGIEDGPLNAVAYMGTRPVYQGKKMILEVHILDFDRDLYGRRLEIELIDKLREEGRIDSETTLLRQIKKDVQQAKREFNVKI